MTTQRAQRRTSTASSSTMDDYRAFLATAFRNPRMIGAAAPTSSVVATTVAQVVPTTGTPVVLELGPGTGSLSSAIHERLPQPARHVAIELNEELVQYLRNHKPWLEVVHGDAANLNSLLADRGVTQVDALITSIPWTLFDDDLQRTILHQCTSVLAPHGAFTALTYMPAARHVGGRHFRKLLDTTFDEVLTPLTWRNFPPLMHYICRRPLP